MSNISTLCNPHIFYGWFVVAAAVAIAFVGFGSAYAFSAFVDSLQQDFGASRGSVSLAFSLAGFLYFGLGIVTGPPGLIGILNTSVAFGTLIGPVAAGLPSTQDTATRCRYSPASAPT